MASFHRHWTFLSRSPFPWFWLCFAFAFRSPKLWSWPRSPSWHVQASAAFQSCGTSLPQLFSPSHGGLQKIYPSRAEWSLIWTRCPAASLRPSTGAPSWLFAFGCSASGSGHGLLTSRTHESKAAAKSFGSSQLGASHSWRGGPSGTESRKPVACQSFSDILQDPLLICVDCSKEFHPRLNNHHHLLLLQHSAKLHLRENHYCNFQCQMEARKIPRHCNLAQIVSPLHLTRSSKKAIGE